MTTEPLVRSLLLIVLGSVAICSFSRAGESVGYPHGIFISGGRYQSPQVLSYPFVDGALLRVGWSELEPAPGQYDWAYLDSEIRKVKRAGKKYTLAIVGGPSSPSWLYDSYHAASFTFSISSPYAPGLRDRRLTIPVPWDPVFLSKWTEMVKAIGERYRNDPDLALVHITGSSANGFELMLPYARANSRIQASIPDWHDYGFSKAKFISAWERIIDAYIHAFPGKYLDFEIHDVLNDDSIPAQLVKYGISKDPGRFGPFGAWLNNRGQRWTQRLRHIMARTPGRPYCDYQLIGNQTRQAWRLGPGGLKGTLESGLSDGCQYFEVWEIDIRNPEYRSLFARLHNRIANGARTGHPYRR